jgi:hypothetical protein
MLDLSCGLRPGALAEAARRLGVPERDMLDLAPARSAWRSMVTVRLGAGNVRLAWSKTARPALTTLSELVHASALTAADRERSLHDHAAPTALERAVGPVDRRLGAQGGGEGATVASPASEFDRRLAPSIRQPRTRAD